MNYKSGLIISFMILAMPFFILVDGGHRPGTDDYLLDQGLTEQQLSTPTATEKREPFLNLTDETSIGDEIGDVLSRSGTHPQINYSWGDLTKASLIKNSEKQCWQFDFTVANEIPANPTSLGVNFLIYIDSDGQPENNTNEGIRFGTDYEVSIKYDVKNQDWFTDLRWYNQAADFWATNKTSASTFNFGSNNLLVCIPFSEISESVTPDWHIAVALSDGQNTQIDVAPGIGFPPPKGETYATWKTNDSTTADNQKTSTNSYSLINWNALITVGILAGLGIVIKLVFWFINKKQKNKQF